MVPRTIIRMAISIVFAIRLVVFLIIRDKIVQCEPIVRRYEIDAGPRLAAAPIEEVRRTRESSCKIRQGTGIALPISPHCIAILVVPLSPAGWEATDLISARPAVPRLGDQLYRREHGVLSARIQK